MCDFPNQKDASDKYDWESIVETGKALYRYADPKAFPIDQTEVPSSVFADRNLSCDIAEMVDDPRDSPHFSHGKTMLIEIIVTDVVRNPTNPKRDGELIESWHQTIIKDPLIGSENPFEGDNTAHALIIGSKKKAITSALQISSRMIDLTS